MARFLCAYKVKGEDDKPQLKVEMHTTKTDDIEKGKIELMVKLSSEHSIPAQFVEKYSDDLGIVYINPHKLYCPTSLCDENMDEEDE